MVNKFKIGDVVKLKSGSPNMTIKRYMQNTAEQIIKRAEPSDSTMVECEWFEENKLKKGRFEQDLLVIVE